MRAKATFRAAATSLIAVLAAVLMVGGPAAPAAAAGSSNTLCISQDASGRISILAGAVLQAGPVVKVKVASAYSQADPEIFQLRNGATLAQMDVKITEAGQGGQVAADAMKWFLQNTTFYGGLSAQGSVRFDLVMPPGNYYVAQLRPVPANNIWPSTTARSFKVSGTPRAIQPYADQKLTMTDAGGVDRFSWLSTTGSLHNGPITIANRTGGIGNPLGELHFAQFTQVAGSTTDAQIQAWLAGGPPPVFVGGAYNFGTLSPQRPAHVYLNVPPGRYAVLSWIPDKDTGTPHALEGMYLLVDIV
ncbi:MAG TPA: hypothetical protein VLA88_04555 [Candidatus Saccharimonadales bacterium]|nr:hypothetical protein [Candidatus Saccharimonadales bacterium]